MSKKNVFISFDIEADGPAPLVHSMISLGAVAIVDGQEVGSFDASIKPIEGGIVDPSTAEWWKQWPEAYAHTQKDALPPKDALTQFCGWVEAMNAIHKPVSYPLLAAYPASFDFPWIVCYCHKFLGKNPFGFTCFDMKSFAAGLLGKHPYQVTKNRMPKSWHHDSEKPHFALPDARAQGKMLIEMLRYSQDS